ncbi:MAG TPA: TRAP transporter large permease subunit [Candidatus Saccharimonadia bacterium]|nr:TRAP transporter large permease subunit [Candidatus Saccharimonadia bacterium]
MIALLALALLLLALLGAPLFAVIAAVAMLGLQAAGYDLTIVAAEFFRITEMPVLIAIPLFTIAGYLLGESRAPKRLVRLSDALFGWLPGGLAIVALVICALFTAFTGATGVTIVALGAVLYPALRHARYPEPFSLGLVTTSGSLGLLFAPSLPLIIYAVVAQQLVSDPAVRVEDLFLAGLLPGLMMIAMLAAYSAWVARGIDRPAVRFDASEARAAIWDARWELPLPVLVLGGIYGGLIAPSEAAAVTALYVALVVLVLRREVSFGEFPRIARESMLLVGAILMILGVALALTNWLLDAEVPARLFEWIRARIDSRLVFLLVLNLFLLVFGMLLEGLPAIMILVPLVLPIALGYGIHPVHFGIMFLANLQVGFFMPPLGMNLFVASHRFDKPVLAVIAACWPFFLIQLAAVLLITYWPDLSLVLVR